MRLLEKFAHLKPGEAAASGALCQSLIADGQSLIALFTSQYLRFSPSP
jgi:hypothetical protein